MQEASRIARRLSALESLGFERVEPSPLTTETVRVNRRTHKVTVRTAAMGTLVSISAVVRSPDQAEEAIGRAFEEMRRLIGVFSRFEGSSAVTALNADGVLDSAPPEFSTVVSQALHYHSLSGGAFDISVEPVVELFRERQGTERPDEPTHIEVREALTLVGSGDIEVSGRTIGFKKSGMGITLDGIAKGYIVDAIATVLDRHGIRDYLINAGGDIRSAGTRGDTRPWTVAVQDPAKRADFPDVIHLREAAVATSGGYEAFFDRNRLFHHIVDAESGTSPNQNLSVSVVAPSAMTADALATGVFVLDPQTGIRLIESMAGCACLIIDHNGTQLKSKGWPGSALVTEHEATS